MPLLCNTPRFLHQPLPGSASCDHPFLQNIRKHDRELSVEVVTAKCMNRGPVSSYLNRTTTLQGHMYRRLVLKFMLPILDQRPHLCTSLILIEAQIYQRTRSVPQLNVHLMPQLIKMVHQVKPYLQTCESLREWVLGAPTLYHLLILPDRRPTSDHVRRYDAPTGSEEAVVVVVVHMESAVGETWLCLVVSSWMRTEMKFWVPSLLFIAYLIAFAMPLSFQMDLIDGIQI